MCSTTLKQIAISRRNYDALKKLGGAGDSFNDVISQLLKTAVITEKEMKEVSCAPSTVTSAEGSKKVVVQSPMTQERSET
jgi:predicted CopG family antitoxin